MLIGSQKYMTKIQIITKKRTKNYTARLWELELDLRVKVYFCSCLDLAAV